jgi:hypothetical protein
MQSDDSYYRVAAIRNYVKTESPLQVSMVGIPLVIVVSFMKISQLAG